MNRLSLVIVMLLYVAAGAEVATADVRLPGMFSDGMVLQRDIKLPVWGWAAPGEQVTVAIAGQKASATADKDGKWRVTLEPLKADGKAQEMTVSGSSAIVIKDVLVGEVWMCSGQSNMAIPVQYSLNAQAEIASADLPQIRLYNAIRYPSCVPQTEHRGSWLTCSPRNAGSWPSAAFYFARYLHKQLGVPVGLLNTSMGSMPIQTFTSLESLKAVPSAKPAMEAHEELVRDYLAHRAERDKAIVDAKEATRQRLKWVGEQAQREENPQANAAVGADTSQWTEIDLPVAKDAVLFPQAGIYWLRKQVDIPQQWVGRQLIVGGFAVADCDQPYVDGQAIAGGAWVESFDASGGRWYVVKPEQVKGTKLTLAIRLLNVTGKPCFNGDPNAMVVVPRKPEKDEKAVVISGKWLKHQAVQINAGKMPVVPAAEPIPGTNGEHPEALYNSSIVPLAPYALRGAIWYQGEGNVSDPDGYALALPALISDWRKLWGQGDFAFGVVQLPNFQGRQEMAINHGWSEFREAQYKGVQAVKNAGLVVTIDIGEANDIHPRNKQEVGRRLGLWALANVYDKKDLAWTGPVYKSMKIEGNKVRLAFEHINGGLQAKGGELTGFAIAGADKVFHLTHAQIDGASVVVWSDKVAVPVAVRYAWAENPVCNLYDKADLPAMPFRTDDWAVKDVKAAEHERVPPAVR